MKQFRHTTRESWAVVTCLGFTRSGVYRGAVRGQKILEEDLALKNEVEALVNRSTTLAP